MGVVFCALIRIGALIRYNLPVGNGSWCIINTTSNSNGLHSGSLTDSSGNGDRSGKNGLFLTHLNNWSGRLDRSGSGNWYGSGNRSGIGGGREVISRVHFNNTNGLRLNNGLSNTLNNGLRSGSESQSGSGCKTKRSGSSHNSVTKKLSISALSFPHNQPFFTVWS